MDSKLLSLPSGIGDERVRVSATGSGDDVTTPLTTPSLRVPDYGSLGRPLTHRINTVDSQTIQLIQGRTVACSLHKIRFRAFMCYLTTSLHLTWPRLLPSWVAVACPGLIDRNVGRGDSFESWLGFRCDGHPATRRR